MYPLLNLILIFNRNPELKNEIFTFPNEFAGLWVAGLIPESGCFDF